MTTVKTIKNAKPRPQTVIDDESETAASEMFMLFGDALALPYNKENETKMTEAFKVARDHTLSLGKQAKRPN